MFISTSQAPAFAAAYSATSPCSLIFPSSGEGRQQTGKQIHIWLLFLIVLRREEVRSLDQRWRGEVGWGDQGEASRWGGPSPEKTMRQHLRQRAAHVWGAPGRMGSPHPKPDTQNIKFWHLHVSNSRCVNCAPVFSFWDYKGIGQGNGMGCILSKNLLAR